MIQDIFPHKLNNQYYPQKKPMEKDYVLCVKEGKVLVKKEEMLVFPTVEEIGKEHSYIFLFSVDDKSYYLFMAKDLDMNEDYEYVDARILRNEGNMEKHLIFAMVTGKHLADWYGDMQFCGRCGAKMVHATTERAMKCTACNYRAYPRIMPAVIVGVTNKDKIILTKYRTGFAHNALIAGFTEIGETVEETVAREVMEEVGLKVKNIRYYKSQPWGVANDILMGFYCEVDGDTQIHMDENELRYAEWIKREDIVLQPNEFSLTNEMMKMFKEGKI